jgi:hypothetical protein
MYGKTSHVGRLPMYGKTSHIMEDLFPFMGSLIWEVFQFNTIPVAHRTIVCSANWHWNSDIEDRSAWTSTTVAPFIILDFHMLTIGWWPAILCTIPTNLCYHLSSPNARKFRKWLAWAMWQCLQRLRAGVGTSCPNIVWRLLWNCIFALWKYIGENIENFCINNRPKYSSASVLCVWPQAQGRAVGFPEAQGRAVGVRTKTAENMHMHCTSTSCAGVVRVCAPTVPNTKSRLKTTGELRLSIASRRIAT